MENLIALKFHDKFESISEDFGIPFSRLAELIGLQKNSLYTLRKSKNWNPTTTWYLEKIKQLDLVRDMLTEYRRYVILESSGKVQTFDIGKFLRWMFLIWMSSNDIHDVPSYLPPKPEAPPSSLENPQTDREKKLANLYKMADNLKIVTDLSKPIP